MAIACSTSVFCRSTLEDALKGVQRLGFSEIDLLLIDGWVHVNTTDLVKDYDGTRARVDALLAQYGQDGRAHAVAHAPGRAHSESHRRTPRRGPVDLHGQRDRRARGAEAEQALPGDRTERGVRRDGAEAAA